MNEATSAGAMLRQARETRGLDLDQLALLLKVPVRKLEALEADRHDELPGTAFVRGLATSIARQLEIDPAPVLAALPSAGAAPVALESVTRGLATPYREPFERQRLTHWRGWLRPSRVAPLALLLLALLVWQAPAASTWLPEGLVQSWSDLKARLAGGGEEAPTTVTETPVTMAASGVMASADGADSGGAVAVAGAPSAVIETVHSAPREELLPAAPVVPASASAKGSAKAAAAAASAAELARPAYSRTVVLRTRADSWIEARDAAGAVLLSRMLPAGETVGLEGSLPIRLKIGNADGTEVLFRGKPVDLIPLTRENVARVELN